MEQGLGRLGHNLTVKENVECDTVPAAQRRDVKARHGSAGGQRWNRTSPARDGTEVVTQSLEAVPSTGLGRPEKPLAAAQGVGVHEFAVRHYGTSVSEIAYPSRRIAFDPKGRLLCRRRSNRWFYPH